ncbi:MAG: alpha-galactosidase, partial [Bacteroidales bacterium]|nr:alpha-galactosidase [Bacteroidales bacterium]
MKKITRLIATPAAALLLTITTALSQATYRFSEKKLVLDNGFISRTISFSGDSACTSSIKMPGSDRSFTRMKSGEFRFSLNGNLIDSYSGWKLLDCTPVNMGSGGSGAVIRLRGTGKAEGIELEISYLTFKGLPLVKKSISFISRSGEDLRLEAVDTETLHLGFDYVSTWVYHNYARMKSLGTYVGNWDDPVVVIHNTSARSGIAVGNEAPGVLKRTAFHTSDRNLDAGLTRPGQDFPFRKWLKPGERWSAPAVFTAFYNNSDNGYEVVNGVVNDYVRKHMGTRISAISEKPHFVYNTWYPFRTFLTDSLVRDVAKAAAECGIQEFIIDDGWQYNAGKRSSDRGWGGNYGDWLVDRNKFPDDLAATFDYIRSLGMKPGLWLSIGSATTDSRVFREHPEWFVKNSDGKTGNLHLSSSGGDFATSCFGTGWTEYIKGVILRLVKDHGL